MGRFPCLQEENGERLCVCCVCHVGSHLFHTHECWPKEGSNSRELSPPNEESEARERGLAQGRAPYKGGSHGAPFQLSSWDPRRLSGQRICAFSGAWRKSRRRGRSRAASGWRPASRPEGAIAAGFLLTVILLFGGTSSASCRRPDSQSGEAVVRFWASVPSSIEWSQFSCFASVSR